MVLVGRDLQDHPLPTTQQWADTFCYARLLKVSLKYENTFLKKNNLHFKPTQPAIYGLPEEKLRELVRHLYDMFWQPEVQHAAEVPISAFSSPHT